MNFSLRDIEENDHEWLVELHNDPVVLHNVTNPKPITLKEHLSWFKSLNSNKELRKIFYIDNDRAGFCKFYFLDHVNKNCMLGADLHKDYRGKRLAKEMWRLMLSYCFDSMGFHRVSLTTSEYNSIAIRVYEGLGFQCEGRYTEALYRDGKYHDQVCYYMLKERWLKCF